LDEIFLSKTGLEEAVEDTAPEQKKQAGTHPPRKESQRDPNCTQNKPRKCENHHKQVAINKVLVTTQHALIKAVHLKMLDSSQTS